GDQLFGLELGARVGAALVGARLEVRGLADRALARGARPVDHGHRRDVHELADAVLLARVDHVLRPDDGAALVLGPAALHRRAPVDHALAPAPPAVDGGGIAEVAEHVLDTLLGPLGDPALEHAHAVAVGAQPAHRRLAE